MLLKTDDVQKISVFYTSLHDVQCYSLRFSVPSSLLQPVSYILFRTLPSTTSFLNTSRCFSVTLHWLFLRSMAWTGSSQTPPFNSSHACLAAHFFQQTIMACFRSIFLTSSGQTTFVSTTTCSSKIKACQCRRLIPRFRVSHTTTQCTQEGLYRKNKGEHPNQSLTFSNFLCSLWECPKASQEKRARRTHLLSA